MNKVILVTGGSKGIGANIVTQLAIDGYNLILNYNNSEKSAKEIQQDLLNKGKKIEISLSHSKTCAVAVAIVV